MEDSQRLRSEILASATRVHERPEPTGIDGHRHRVDRKVPTPKVVVQHPCADPRIGGGFRIRLLSARGEIHPDVIGGGRWTADGRRNTDRRGAELLVNLL